MLTRSCAPCSPLHVNAFSLESFHCNVFDAVHNQEFLDQIPVSLTITGKSFCDNGASSDLSTQIVNRRFLLIVVCAVVIALFVTSSRLESVIEDKLVDLFTPRAVTTTARELCGNGSAAVSRPRNRYSRD